MAAGIKILLSIISRFYRPSVSGNATTPPNLEGDASRLASSVASILASWMLCKIESCGAFEDGDIPHTEPGSREDSEGHTGDVRGPSESGPNFKRFTSRYGEADWPDATNVGAVRGRIHTEGGCAADSFSKMGLDSENQ